MTRAKFILGFIVVSRMTHGQQLDDKMFSRLQAISNNGVDFFNVDGVEISSQQINASFTPRSISKNFKQLRIKKNEIVFEDSLLGIQNFYVFKTHLGQAGFEGNFSYYFVKDTDSTVVGFSFVSKRDANRDFERKFIKLVVNDQIPDSVYNDLKIDSIDFAGRKIPLGGSCKWMGVNNVQCPYYGQMNWSVHEDLEGAEKTVHAQFESIKSRKRGKVVEETSVDVLFEGTETKAKKVIYDFTGVTGALVGMSGGKTLTIYFVAAEVRDNYVSCGMSFWNNDQITLSGLPPLLEQVMQLQ